MTRWLGSFWVRAGLTGLILAYLLRQVDGGAALRAMLQVDPGRAAGRGPARPARSHRDDLALGPAPAGQRHRDRDEIGRTHLPRQFLCRQFPARRCGWRCGPRVCARPADRPARRGGGVGGDRPDSGRHRDCLDGGDRHCRLCAQPSGPAGAIGGRSSAVAVLVGSVAAVWADRWIRWLPSSWHTWTPVRLPLRIADAVAEYRQQPGTLAIVFAPLGARPVAADPAGVRPGPGARA